ncbi:MAG: nitrilase-related carbon-nitrogen hydrolase, partial [Vicinamibacterales bacterium]
MRLALLQLNPTVGAIEDNAARLGERLARCRGVDLCVATEMALTGYPPRDLLLQPDFIQRAWEVLGQFAAAAAQAPPVLVGLPVRNPAPLGRPLFNAAALVHGGTIARVFHKALLPTYDVFDEDRYFEPGVGGGWFDLDGTRVAVSICEDIWNDRDFWARRRYRVDPVEEADRSGAAVLVNLSASPFAAGKQDLRERMIAALAQKYEMTVAYVNQTGGNDDLIFDGRSFVCGPHGTVVARAEAFAEDTLIVETAVPP